MGLDVKVKIDLTRPIGKAGFGYPLLLEAGVTGESVTEVDYTVCTSLADVVDAGLANTTTIYKTAALMLAQDNAPKKFAVMYTKSTYAEALAAVVDKEWRQLICMDAATATASAVATYIDTTDDKLYFTSITTQEGGTDTANKNRTVVFYYTADNVSGARVEAALVGATAGLDVGSFTYKNIILTGIDPLDLTDTEISALNTKNVISVVSKAGDIVTTEGKTRKGEYIDIIDSKDYVLQNLEYKTQKMLNNNKKIPYDNNGIAMLESVAIDVMKDAFNKGIIATDSDGNARYEVSYALAEDVSDEDKAARKYIGGNFKFYLAGAIHEVEITGEIVI